VTLSCDGEQLVPGIAAVVNRHGALVVAPIRCAEGELVVVTNRASRDTTTCRVVYVAAPTDSCGQRVGIEFVDDVAGFWGAEYEMLASASALAVAEERHADGFDRQ
jgi:hypothetical protein